MVFAWRLSKIHKIDWALEHLHIVYNVQLYIVQVVSNNGSSDGSSNGTQCKNRHQRQRKDTKDIMQIYVYIYIVIVANLSEIFAFKSQRWLNVCHQYHSEYQIALSFICYTVHWSYLSRCPNSILGICRFTAFFWHRHQQPKLKCSLHLTRITTFDMMLSLNEERSSNISNEYNRWISSLHRCKSKHKWYVLCRLVPHIVSN